MLEFNEVVGCIGIEVCSVLVAEAGVLWHQGAPAILQHVTHHLATCT